MPLRHSTLRQFRVFEAAARHQSFARAAAELHLSQPAISMQVKELEAHAGLPLFERIGRRMYITDAGRELLRHSTDLLGAVAAAEDTLDALRGLRAGRLSLAVVSTAKYFALRLLARFRERHPAVEIRLSVSNRDSVFAALTSNSVDLAIMGRPPDGADTVALPFAPHPLVIIAPPDHPLAGRRRIPVKAMAQEIFLVREPGSGTRSAMETFFAKHAVAIKVGMEMASNETIKQAAMAGMGVSFISRHTVSLELETGRLTLLDVQGLPVMRHWHVAHLSGKRLAPTVQAFRDFVLAEGRPLLAEPVQRPSRQRPRPSGQTRRTNPSG